jgi:hypothetical protein
VLLVHTRSNLALLSGINSLVLKILALRAHAVCRIHALLEFIILPAKNVVTVLSETGVITVAQIEGLGAVGRPKALVVERGSVPDDLVHELRNTNGVGGRAAASEAEEVRRARGRICHVSLMVRRVEVLPVPTAACC